MSNDVKLEPEAIWLSPRCDAEARHCEGRSWANPAPEAACDDCGLPWVKYVRADLASHQPQREAVLEGLLTRFGLVLTDDPDFDHDEQTFEKAKASFVAALTTPAPAQEREAVLEEGNKRGLYDTTKIGPELVAFLDDRGGMLAALRDEMSEGYRGWLDDAVGALQIARDHLAALTTPAPAVKPHCSTCGKDVAEVLCETCGKWWADNAPPAPAVSTDDAIEQIVVGFSDKAILRLDIEEDDPRLSRVCDDMRQTVRAILSRLWGEGE